MQGARPLELILARNLMSSISTPSLLVGRAGEIIFYNDAAGALLGRRFEETGRLSAEEWTTEFGPFDPDGNPIPYEQLSLTHMLRHNRPAHSTLHVRSIKGTVHHIVASAVPIVGGDGFQGAIVFFWPQEDEEEGA
jgi:PAS domain-containing protein